METAPCNDTTHGYIIIVTIMGLDGITGGQRGASRAPRFIPSAQKQPVSVSTQITNAGVNYQLITQAEAISLFHSD